VLIFDTPLIVVAEMLAEKTSDAFRLPVIDISVPDKFPVDMEPNVDLN
jgi:hypothetical protein